MTAAASVCEACATASIMDWLAICCGMVFCFFFPLTANPFRFAQHVLMQ